MQLTVKDVAVLLNVSEKTIYRWLQQCFIPAYKVNNSYRFNRAELLEWATSKQIRGAADMFVEPDEENVEQYSLHNALKEGGINYRVSSKDKKTAIRAVVDIMRLPEEVDREFLFQILCAREDLASTAIGDGIAIPHVRNPIVLHITKPLITLCFLENEIDFGAIDGKPVYCLFTIISPTVKRHLHMLSRLGYALQDAEFKKLIRNRALREDILSSIKRIETQIDKTAVTQQNVS